MFAVAAWMMTSCQGTNTPEDPEDGVARYSILVYGNAGGHMDHIMESLWERLKPQMKSKQVRISFLYKDGQLLILRGDKTYTLTGQEIH